MAKTTEEDATFLKCELLWMAWTSFSLHLHMSLMFCPFNMSKVLVPVISCWYGCFVESEESSHKAFSRYLARKQCSRLTFRIQHFLSASYVIFQGGVTLFSSLHILVLQCGCTVSCLGTGSDPDNSKSRAGPEHVLLIMRTTRLKGEGALNPLQILFCYRPVWLVWTATVSSKAFLGPSF